VHWFLFVAVLDEDDDDEDEQTQQSQESRKHRKKSAATKSRETLNLSRSVEDDIVNWIKEHPSLYDKSLDAYRKMKDKKSLWTQKAASLDLTYHQLFTWYESLRTRFGRLSKSKSGQGSKRHTQREEWILKTFEFLKVHISRQPSRSSCNVSEFNLVCT